MVMEMFILWMTYWEMCIFDESKPNHTYRGCVTSACFYSRVQNRSSHTETWTRQLEVGAAADRSEHKTSTVGQIKKKICVFLSEN